MKFRNVDPEKSPKSIIVGKNNSRCTLKIQSSEIGWNVHI